MYFDLKDLSEHFCWECYNYWKTHNVEESPAEIIAKVSDLMKLSAYTWNVNDDTP